MDGTTQAEQIARRGEVVELLTEIAILNEEVPPAPVPRPPFAFPGDRPDEPEGEVPEESDPADEPENAGSGD